MTKTVKEEAKEISMRGSAPEERRSVASFPRILAQVLPTLFLRRTKRR